ncbi:MAG: ComF family protein [Chitinophagales bacterium]|nr:ComF family protein [Chitinophagaceae bacterium]MCB9065208.1 ComF family protein [Chitinophagales bacterium]
MSENIVKDMADGLSHLFYPRLCEGCNKPLLQEEEILCLNCNIYNLPRTAYHHIHENETFMRFAGRVKIEKATSLAYFTENGLLQHLLHRLKYENRKDIGYFLGKTLGYDLQQVKWAVGFDAIVPVPLHPKKEAERGFNQANIIAQGLNEVLNVPVIDNVLYRNRFTESQTQKSREERMLNMREAFSLSEALLLKDKHILLIDDVLTTGATLEACALALSQAEGTVIGIATVGIAG